MAGSKVWTVTPPPPVPKDSPVCSAYGEGSGVLLEVVSSCVFARAVGGLNPGRASDNTVGIVEEVPLLS